MNRTPEDVNEHSDAVDLQKDVFSLTNPLEIAKSLKQLTELNNRKRSKSPFQSAMSILTFYINRNGKSLTETQMETLQQAKLELRKLFGRE